MTDIPINLGDAFLFNTPNKPHLYIAMAKTSNRKYLFVCVVTRKPKSESTCVLLPSSEMPNFIIHESVIDYRLAREINGKTLARVIYPNSSIPQEHFPKKILEQIQQGGLKSKRLKNKYKNALRAFLAMQ